MLSKSSLGIAGAAMLGTVTLLLGTNAANAAINLNASADDKAMPVTTFAKETITEMVMSDEPGTYYKVMGPASGDHQLFLRGLLGVGTVQDAAVNVVFKLDGMVFSEPVSAADFQLIRSGTDITNKVTVALVSGGIKGGMEARFQIARNDEMLDGAAGHLMMTDVFRLDIESLGVSEDGGSVGVEVTNVAADETISMSYMNAVQLGRALDETAIPMNPMTYVARSYTDFVENMEKKASIGTFGVGVAKWGPPMMMMS